MPAPPQESEPAMVRAMAVMTTQYRREAEKASRPIQPILASPGKVSSIQAAIRVMELVRNRMPVSTSKRAEQLLDRRRDARGSAAWRA